MKEMSDKIHGEDWHFKLYRFYGIWDYTYRTRRHMSL